MRVKDLCIICLATALNSYAVTAQADWNNSDHRWMPKPPQDKYWDEPDWSAFRQQSEQRAAASRATSVNNPGQRPVAAPPGYRPPPMPAPNYRSAAMARPANPAMAARPAPVRNQNAPVPPPPRGPYTGAPGYGPGNGPSAFYPPGYRSNRVNRRNNWNRNRFWGRSGPSSWMNPNKRNMEDGWDDMMNAPSRMGTMPGGWTAPEVSMPNPVDVGDQIQDNVKDLPDQVRDMNVGDEGN